VEGVHEGWQVLGEQVDPFPTTQLTGRARPTTGAVREQEGTFLHGFTSTRPPADHSPPVTLVTLTLNKSPIFKPDTTVLQITPGPAREAAASDPRPPPSMPAAALLPPQGSAAVSNASPPGAAASETEDPRALRVADGTLASDSIHGTATGSYSVSGNAVEQESDLSSPVTGVEGTATTIVQPSPAEAVLETESADPRTFQPRPASSSGQAQLGSPTKLTASLNALNEPGEEEEEQEDVEEVEEVEEKGATASAQERHVNEDVDMESPALAVADIAVASSTSAPHHSPPTQAEEHGAVTSESRSADILAANPSQLLNGLRMWLDPKLPSRSDLLARIKRAGGTIAIDYPHATHVLVHDYASNAKYWDGVIKTMTKRGVWFVHANWATKSLEDNVIQPELGFCLPGGTPSTSTLRAVQEDAKPTQLLGKGKEPRISTENLAELFQREWNAHEGSITSLLDGIFEKVCSLAAPFRIPGNVWLTAVRGVFEGSLEQTVRRVSQPERPIHRHAAARRKPVGTPFTAASWSTRRRGDWDRLGEPSNAASATADTADRCGGIPRADGCGSGR